MPNEFLQKFNELFPSVRRDNSGQAWDILSRPDRIELVTRYAWSVPSDEALALMTKYGPIVEGGAGSGYWAYLLRECGVDVVAYDTQPYDNEFVNARWTTVEVGGAEAMAAHRDRALFLCWPPHHSTMASDHLRAHGGSTVIYVGESRGGCTGDEAFFDLLESDFEEVEWTWLPRFCGINDALTVYRRKGS